jgi:hypothetical protein
MPEHNDVGAIFEALRKPFGPEQIRTRPQGGQKLKYVTARHVMNRLDEVVGNHNWWDDYTPGQDSVMCRLTLRLPDGSTITKCDAGGYAGMSDQGDDDKSGFSDSFKRAAVKFGVGRHLYGDGLPGDASFEAEKESNIVTPVAPRRGPTPQPSRPTPRVAPPQEPSRGRTFDNFSKVPPPGKAVFAWAKSLEEHYQAAVVPFMRSTGEQKGYGTDFTKWDGDESYDVCMKTVSHISQQSYYGGEFDNLLKEHGIEAGQ